VDAAERRRQPSSKLCTPKLRRLTPARGSLEAVVLGGAGVGFQRDLAARGKRRRARRAAGGRSPSPGNRLGVPPPKKTLSPAGPSQRQVLVEVGQQRVDVGATGRRRRRFGAS
jgi:hypothetical protein